MVRLIPTMILWYKSIMLEFYKENNVQFCNDNFEYYNL